MPTAGVRRAPSTPWYTASDGLSGAAAIAALRKRRAPETEDAEEGHTAQELQDQHARALIDEYQQVIQLVPPCTPSRASLTH